MLLFDRPPYASPSPTNPLEEQALARGVAWRTIYAPDSLEISGQPNEVRRLISLGEQARVNQHVPLKLAIAVREVGLVPLTSAHPETQLVVVHASSLFDALVDLFELYWAQALPMGRLPGRAQAHSDQYRIGPSDPARGGHQLAGDHDLEGQHRSGVRFEDGPHP